VANSAVWPILRRHITEAEEITPFLYSKREKTYNFFFENYRFLFYKNSRISEYFLPYRTVPARVRETDKAVFFSAASIYTPPLSYEACGR
jgi:hypothetical protein